MICAVLYFIKFYTCQRLVYFILLIKADVLLLTIYREGFIAEHLLTDYYILYFNNLESFYKLPLKLQIINFRLQIQKLKTWVNKNFCPLTCLVFSILLLTDF